MFQPERTLVLRNSQALTATPTLSLVVDIETWSGVGLEIISGTMVGNLEIVVELADDDQYFAVAVADLVAATTGGNDFMIPVKRQEFTIANGSSALTLPIIVAGYNRMRLSVTAGTSGSAMIWVKKLPQR